MSCSGATCSQKAEINKQQKRMIIGGRDHERHTGAKGIFPYLIRLFLESTIFITSVDN